MNICSYILTIKPNHMHVIQITLPEYEGIRSGLASAILIDETNELIVNDKVVLVCPGKSDLYPVCPPIECSINALRSDKMYSGMKKGHSLVFLSVIGIVQQNHALDVSEK